MKPTHILTLLILLLFIGCKSQQYTFEELPEKYIQFGSGGGVTGMVNTFTLLPNGQLFKHNSLSKEYTELPNVPKDKVKLLFKMLAELKDTNPPIEQPGNMFAFLEEMDGKSTYRTVWDTANPQVSEEIRTLYKMLYTTTN
jgi:hypothetical protein